MESHAFLRQIMYQIKLHREDAGISQAKMSDLLKIGIRSYQRYETCDATPSINFLHQASKLLSLNLKDIISPLENMKSIGDITFFSQDQLADFLSDSPSELKELFDLIESPYLKQAMTENDPSILRQEVRFQNTSGFFALSTIKTTLLNGPAQLQYNSTTDLVSTATFHNKPKNVAILWGSLLQVRPAYFIFKRTVESSSGTIHYDSFNIFMECKNNYFVLRNIQIRSEKQQ